ncbi:hypothetical protein SBV1_2380009 [Verrucomicrobia bacterium]|nr:hypothetical protein SBV1_2380009 [Verrucomicrobiota bacterium]
MAKGAISTRQVCGRKECMTSHTWASVCDSSPSLQINLRLLTGNLALVNGGASAHPLKMTFDEMAPL